VPTDPSTDAVMLGMSGAVVAVACGALVLLAAAAGYVAGTRRRPPRHGTIRLRDPRSRRKG
jgi:uncharacterized iron-regulated membrane protein